MWLSGEDETEDDPGTEVRESKTERKAYFLRHRGQKFADMIRVEVQAGKGGDGSRSLKRERHMPKGEPPAVGFSLIFPFIFFIFFLFSS